VAAERPVLIVPFDRGAATAWEIVAATPQYADVVFVCPTDSPNRARMLPILQACASTVAAHDPEEALATLADRAVAGVVTFSDRTLGWGAALSKALGCAFHTPELAAVLTDKLRQRDRLRAGGVTIPRLVTPERAADIADAAAAVGYPCVIKPRRSFESRHTYCAANEASARKAAHDAAAVWEGVGGFIVEEMLRGDPRIAGPHWGHYVSVESLVVDGQVHHLAVVGKLPFVEPFREAGHIFPSTLSPSTLAEVRQAATDAVAALGIRHGACQTEIMLSTDGPRIIEVNGRLGGFISKVIELATGVSLLQLTVATALGDYSGLADLPNRLADARSVGFAMFVFPPPDWPTAGRLGKVRGLDTVRRLPGVSSAVVAARRGDLVDTAMGTGSSIVHVYGIVPDHRNLAHLVPKVIRAIVIDLATHAPTAQDR
jgi:biotin carboxylase